MSDEDKRPMEMDARAAEIRRALPAWIEKRLSAPGVLEEISGVIADRIAERVMMTDEEQYTYGDWLSFVLSEHGTPKFEIDWDVDHEVTADIAIVFNLDEDRGGNIRTTLRKIIEAELNDTALMGAPPARWERERRDFVQALIALAGEIDKWKGPTP